MKKIVASITVLSILCLLLSSCIGFSKDKLEEMEKYLSQFESDIFAAYDEDQIILPNGEIVKCPETNFNVVLITADRIFCSILRKSKCYIYSADYSLRNPELIFSFDPYRVSGYFPYMPNANKIIFRSADNILYVHYIDENITEEYPHSDIHYEKYNNEYYSIEPKEHFNLKNFSEYYFTVTDKQTGAVREIDGEIYDYLMADEAFSRVKKSYDIHLFDITLREDEIYLHFDSCNMFCYVLTYSYDFQRGECKLVDAENIIDHEDFDYWAVNPARAEG